MKRRDRVRNAASARQSIVTKRAELKIDALADMLKIAAGEHGTQIERGTLQREIFFAGLPYLHSLKLIYNWENRFMAVNYNLQMISSVPAEPVAPACRFTLCCDQKGLHGKRSYTWNCEQCMDNGERLIAYQERLKNPLITDRLDALDLTEAEIWHDERSREWRISCESLIGSATWMLIPPVLSMIAPRKEECVRFLELFQLLGDAVANDA